MPSERNHNRNVVWVGLDVAAESFVAAVDHEWVPGEVGEESIRRIPVKEFERSEEGVSQMRDWAKGVAGQEVTIKVLMESTGNYSWDILDWCHAIDPSMHVAILNPRTVKEYLKSLSLRRKDDATDARGMSRLGSERHPRPTPRCTKLELELRSLVRGRTFLIERREGFLDHVRKGRGEFKVHDSAFANVVKTIDRQIERIEKRMKRLIESDARKKADIARLKEIFGVGDLTAMVIIAELFDLRRFESARQLAAYCGMTPRIEESGKRRGKGYLTKVGNPHVRRALYMAAVVNVRFRKTDIADWYHRRVEQGMHKMKAMVVVMRRILDRMYLLLTTDVTYRLRPAEGV